MPLTTNTTPAPTNAVLNDFIGKVESQILAPLVTLMALVAFVVFMWGVVDYIRNADNDEARTKGQQHMLWGFVGFVLIFGATAIISILTGLVGIFK
jgi:uncharacterized membrane protein YidH (DUF202 family)